MPYSSTYDMCTINVSFVICVQCNVSLQEDEETGPGSTWVVRAAEANSESTFFFSLA